MVEYRWMKAVNEKIVECMNKFQSETGTSYSLPSVNYKRMGKVAGRAYAYRNEVHINPDFFSNGHAEDMINSTIPHEIAHIVARKYYLDKYSVRIKSHGNEWKETMCIFGLEPSRCHDYNLEGVKTRNMKVFEYVCACGYKFNIKARTHNQINKGRRRKCVKCMTYIEFTGKVTF